MTEKQSQFDKLYTNLFFQLLLCVLLPGTIPVTHLQEISPVLYRGSDPSKKEMLKLKDTKGIKTFISCRTNPEKSKQRWAEAHGMHLFHIPTGVFITPGPKEINQFLTIVHNPANQPAFISCVIGTDRTSVYVATYQVVDQHYTYEQAVGGMKKNHLKPWWYSFRRYKYVVRDYVNDPQLAKDTEPASTTAAQLNVTGVTGTTSASNPTIKSADSEPQAAIASPLKQLP